MAACSRVEYFPRFAGNARALRRSILPWRSTRKAWGFGSKRVRIPEWLCAGLPRWRMSHGEFFCWSTRQTSARPNLTNSNRRAQSDKQIAGGACAICRQLHWVMPLGLVDSVAWTIAPELNRWPLLQFDPRLIVPCRKNGPPEQEHGNEHHYGGHTGDGLGALDARKESSDSE